MAPAARAGGDAWWNDAWAARRVVTTGEPQKGHAPGETALVDVITNAHARLDGADVRVVDAAGAVQPRRVLAAGDDHMIVLFPAKPKTRYAVYFGNETATEPPEHWAPRAGLVVEARRLDGPPPATWADAEAALATGSALIGRTATPSIASAQDPLGPERDVILRFAGTLDCPEAGTYEMATNSADASFLRVDGHLVAEWGGRHNAKGGHLGTHSGTIDLTKGAHEVDYVYATTGDPEFGCTVGWKPPGAEKMVPVPPTAWVGWIGANAGPIELRKGSAEAEFTWQVTSDLGLAGHEATLLSFVGRPPQGGAAGDATLWRWDFGDGTSGTDARPKHVYVTRGVYDVRLSATRKDGVSLEAKARVRAEPQHGRWPGSVDDRLSEYAGIARGYPPDALTPATALALGRLLLEAGSGDAARPALERALAGGGFDMARRADEDAALALADLWRARREWPRAAALCATLTACPAADGAVRDAATIARAECLLDAGDLDAADAALGPLAERKGGDAPRLARIRRGEVLLARARAADATALLTEIETKDRRGPSGDAALRRGDRSLMFHSRLRAGDFDAAEVEVRTLIWETPTALASGKPQLFLGELRAAQARWADAADLFERSLAIAPDAPHAAEALLRLAAARDRLGEKDRARAALERCVREHAEAPEAETARGMIAEAKKKQ